MKQAVSENRNIEPGDFSGTVHTLVYCPHQGFANYAIATLTIVEGLVEKVELSDPYAGFEAMAKMELMNEKLLDKMRGQYPVGFRHV